MREIKCRAWDKERENMIYQGSNTNKNNGWILGQFIFDDLQVGLIVTTYDEDVIDIMDFELMQYTGLKDKNGKEICEGDICTLSNDIYYSNEYFNTLDDWGMVMQVVKEDYSFKFRDITDKHATIFLFEADEDCMEIEVIGNAYENKEMESVK